VEADPAAESSLPAEVSHAVRALLRAERIVRTYPPGNELRERALSELRPQLLPALPLGLGVRRTGFAFGPHLILEEGRGESELAARLFRDGVRRLDLLADLDDAELARLLTTLATPIHPDDLTEDYVTRLWTAELRSVRVIAADPYLALDVPEQVLEGREVPGGEIEGVLVVDESAGESQAQVPPPPEEAFRITAADAERMAREVAPAEHTPPWESFVEAVFDLLQGAGDQQRVDELVLLIEGTLQRLLADARVELGAALLERLRRPVPAAAEAALRAALDRIATLDRIEPLRQALEARACSADAAKSFLHALRERAPELCCAMLTRSHDPVVQRFLTQVLQELGPAAVAPIGAMFPQAGPALQRQLARLLAGVRDPLAVRTLVSALSFADPALRREALRALAANRDSTALAAIMKTALGDPDASVRLVALRALGEARTELDCSQIVQVLDSNRFQSLGADEKDLLFETLGAIGGPQALECLGRRLRPGWIPGRSDEDDWRRAARALSRMGTEPALALLAEGARSRRRAFASICEGALKAARRRGDVG
jgi:HEAT repeat protein